MQRVELSNGTTVEVRRVPPMIVAAIEKRMPVEDDMSAEEMEQMYRDRERITREVSILHAFEGVDVPDDWEFPYALLYAGVEPRTEALIDYVEYELLQTSDDLRKVQDAMWGEPPKEVAAAAEDTFPGDGEGEAPTRSR